MVGKVSLNHTLVLRPVAFVVTLLLSTYVSSTLLAEDAPSGDDSTASTNSFPKIYNSESEEGEPISPQAAVEALQLPDGFRATLFAGEPEVQNPIASCIDARGRVWVAENYTYAERAQRFDLSLNDRLIVLEDNDGDGVAEKRTVFSDQLKMLTGVTVGRGGVWLMCPPQLLFIPDADGDLVPDGPPIVKLDGFHVGRENYHNFANGLKWGPDSWLYGRCGASAAGEMGLPGATDASRVPIRGGMWRYHPERQVVEALTHGTTNPWGHDWNDVGELFFINTVNGHLWHSLPGAHFVRPHTLDPNPHIFELIDMHADHWHFDTGKSWTASRAGAANDYGGGHAHIGMTIYNDTHWPDRYRGRLMTVNMHGRRVNVERLSRDGAGYVASHDEDFILSDDPWFRGMDLLPCPDGNLLLIDWSDTGECHEHTGVHRTSGRIFKILYEGTGNARSRDNLLKGITRELEAPVALAKLQRDGSEWAARRAREQLCVMRIAGMSLGEDVVEQLEQQLRDSSLSTALRLRGLWALTAIDAIGTPGLVKLLDDADPQLRVWAIRLLTDNWPLDNGDGSRPKSLQLTATDLAILQRLHGLATEDSAAEVRLALATVLQRLPHALRPPLAGALMAHATDANDHNIPLMVWFGLTPLGDDAEQLVPLLNESSWPTTTRLIARRVAQRCVEAPAAFDELVRIASTKDEQSQRDVVEGIAQALAGRRKVATPKGWEQLRQRLSVTQDDELQSQLQNLSILFGDGQTVKQLLAIASDGSQPLELRQTALETLVEARADGITQLCLDLLSVRFLNNTAAAGLARQADPAIGDALVESYRRFHPFDRPSVISILSARPAWAIALLQAVEKGAIDPTEISPFQARQIAGLGDSRATALLAKTWGQVRASSAEKQKLIDKLKKSLTADVLADADLGNGRTVFDKTCSACHTLFGAGGKLGPDLTGAQRANMDYLLDNVIDPSAVVTKEFRATSLLLEDGRVLTGLLTNQTDSSYTLGTQDEIYQIPADEVVEARRSDVSTMPDGLLGQLSDQQIRDLVGYLQSTEQVAPADR